MLSVLSVVSNPSQSSYVSHFGSIQTLNKALPSQPPYMVIAIVSKTNDKILATGTVFIEKKFLRGLGSVGHIEDIAVNKEVQGKRLGFRIIECLTALSEKMGCYKTILNCSDENIREYCFVLRRGEGSQFLG